MNNFQWTDDLIKEMIYAKFLLPHHYLCNVQKYLDEFIEFKKKKEYEILDRFDYYKYACDGDIAPIKSVKRLSDNEIFTVGDKVYETVTGNEQTWSIKEFSLKDTRCFTCGVNIENIKKIKQVLFTTEDGVNVFEGDKLYYVLLDSFEIHTNPSNIHDGNNPKNKYFSTKEAAEEYILINKPILSLNEILNVWSDKGDNPEYYKSAPLFKRFLKAAKEKL